MPSRPASLAILAFWAATAGVVGYRDVWPRYFGDAPPAVRIDLADEATQLAPTRWTISRAGKPVGTLTTRMLYDPKTDTFLFTNKYHQVRLDAGFRGLAVEVPALETLVRVDRAGALQEQSLRGELAIKLGFVELGRADADVTGVVTGGQLVGRLVVRTPPKADPPAVDRPLDPVPVPAGQVLNPLMPLNKLRDVQPGRRWVVRQVNPLADAALIVIKKFAEKSVLGGVIPAPESRELLAEVGGTPEIVERPGLEPVACWVITYRGGEVEARTWVSVDDGRVVRQEAAGFGDGVRFDRQD